MSSEKAHDSDVLMAQTYMVFNPASPKDANYLVGQILDENFVVFSGHTDYFSAKRTQKNLGEDFYVIDARFTLNVEHWERLAQMHDIYSEIQDIRGF